MRPLVPAMMSASGRDLLTPGTLLAMQQRVSPLGRGPETLSGPLQPGQKLDILQLNSHKCKDSNISVEGKANKHDNFIFMLSEPYCNTSGKIAFLNDKDHFLARSTEMAPALPGEEPGLKPVRAAIYAAGHLPITVIQHLCSGDVVVAKIKIKEKNTASWQVKELLICSVYWDGKFDSIPAGLEEALQYAEDFNLKPLVSMDANAHSIAFGSPTQNARGDTLDNFVSKWGLVPINQGSAPTFYGGTGGKTVIDITFGAPEVAAQISDWRVTSSKDTMNSDHRLIAMSLHVDVPKYEWFRDYNSVHWPTFRHKCKSIRTDISLRNYFLLQDLEDKTDVWVDTVTTVLDEMCPAKKRQIKSKISRWFSPRCEKLWREKNRLKLLPKTPKTCGELNAVEKEWKRVRRGAIRDTTRKLYHDSNTPQLTSKLNKIMANKPCQRISLLRRNDGVFTGSVEESINILMDKCFPGSKAYTKSYWDERMDLARLSESRGPIALKSFPHVTEARMRQAINGTFSHKSSGPDQIKPMVLKHLPGCMLSDLKDIYTGCLSSGHTPLAWQKAKVCFIPKQGKPDYLSPGSFRPITLSNHPLKILEKLILWHNLQTVMKDRPLSDKQHAFRAGRSTESAALYVVNNIDQALTSESMNLSVFMDVAGAFDCVTSDAIIRAMTDRGIDEYEVRWYENYISYRIVSVSVGHADCVRIVSRGCPQGGVLSVLAWNLVFDDLLKMFDGQPVDITGFADDGTLQCSGKFMGPMVRKMNNALVRVSSWAEDKGLTISKEKTVAVLFAKGNSNAKAKQSANVLMLEGTPVKFVKEVKFLGMILDQKLTWKPHIDYVIAKAKRTLFMYKKAFKPNWGPTQEMIRWLFTAIVRPGIIYCSLVWGLAVMTTTWAAVLRRVQALATTHQGMFRKKTPRLALEVLSGIPPLHLFIREQLLQSANRNCEHINSLLTKHRYNDKAFIKTLQRELKGVGVSLNEHQKDRAPKTRLHERKFHLTEGTFDQGWPKVLPGISVYTDGSKIGGQTGAGAFIQTARKDFELVCHLSPDTTVFQAELYAIYHAATFLLSLDDIDDVPIHFYVDSQAALKALMTFETDSKTVLITVESLETLCTKHPVHLNWVRAHAGQVGNEAADELAKFAASNSFGPLKGYEIRIPFTPSLIPHIFFKRKIGEDTIVRWNREWWDYPRCRQTKMFFPQVDLPRAKLLYRTDKCTYSAAIRWITGHNGLMYQNNKIDPMFYNNPQCRMCDDGEVGNQNDETTLHVMTECPKVQELRQDCFGERFLDEADLKTLKPDRIHLFLKSYAARTLEYTDECPILFFDNLANHSLSFSLPGSEDPMGGSDDPADTRMGVG